MKVTVELNDGVTVSGGGYFERESDTGNGGWVVEDVRAVQDNEPIPVTSSMKDAIAAELELASDSGGDA